MLLLLMRHAEAEPVELHECDDLRPLTARGEKTQTQVAEALRKMGVVPHYILASPRRRTVQTAALTAAALGLPRRIVRHEALGAGYSVGAVIDMLRGFDQDHSILCVGHDPDLREIACALLGIADLSAIKFPKSGVLGIESRGHPRPAAGVLRFFYRPRDLLALA